MGEGLGEEGSRSTTPGCSAVVGGKCEIVCFQDFQTPEMDLVSKNDWFYPDELTENI